VDLLDDNELRREVRGLLSSGQLRREILVGELSKVLLPWSALGGLKAGEGQQRLSQLAQAVDPARTPVLSVLSLARALLQAGDVPGTERLLRAVLAERPDQVAALTVLGNLLRTQKRWQEAIGCYRAARALRPYLGISLAAALGEVDRAAEGEAILRTLSQKS